MEPKFYALYDEGTIQGKPGSEVKAIAAVFPDGYTVVRWDAERKSTQIYDSFEDWKYIAVNFGNRIIAPYGEEHRWNNDTNSFFSKLTLKSQVTGEQIDAEHLVDGKDSS